MSHPYIAQAGKRKEFDMPQMFDWILYAILILPLIFLTWDWLRNR